MTLLAFFAGLFIGTAVGIFVLALCMTAGKR